MFHVKRGRKCSDLKLFWIYDDEAHRFYEVKAIHDENGYQKVREHLAQQYNLSMREPNIQVYNVDIRGDRSITLHHIRQNNIPLNDDVNEVLKHFHHLWGFDVHLKSYDDSGRLTKVQDFNTGVSTQYSYNALGQRVGEVLTGAGDDSELKKTFVCPEKIKEEESQVEELKYV